MQYNQPYNKPDDPNASFIDGDPERGIEGSIIPTAEVELTQREIVNVIVKNGFIPNNDDQAQLSRGVQQDLMNYGVDFGTVNKMAVTLDPAPITYSVGLKIFILVKFNNTSSVTLNVNGMGDVPVLTTTLEELGVDNIVTNGIALVYYDGRRFQLLYQAKSSGGPAGAMGASGPQGLPGANGVKGAKGDRGDTGAAGADGKSGVEGLNLVVSPGAVGSYAFVGGGYEQGSYNEPFLFGHSTFIISPIDNSMHFYLGGNLLNWNDPQFGTWRIMSTMNNAGGFVSIAQRFA